jgi:hypothetical protein
MFDNLNKQIYEPPDTTLKQREINEQEWKNPDNWKGSFFPSYTSKLDNRPLVPTRWFPPKKGEKKYRHFLKPRSFTPNRAHSRGRAWLTFSWLVLVAIFLLWIVLQLIYK